MSHHSSNAAAQPHSVSGHALPHHPELAQRIERLQEATKALLDLYEQDKPHYEPDKQCFGLNTSRAGGCEHSALSSKPRKEADSYPVVAMSGGSRCYCLSPTTVQQERELLKRYRVEDFRGLLAEAHMLLVGLVKMMKLVHPDVRLRGYVVSSLGCLLEQASSLLLRMRNVYENVERIDQ